ncbi:MAG: tRNA 2-thiouridine(34) synthase MnmA [Clostridiales bacterium]|nr:tRNA 2-thiouridine(34) synthase MnmA [Clostridiales bacterium]
MRIVVGLSGGVDSSVCAYLLKQQGHEVIGVFMNNWEDDGVCTAAADFADARSVAQLLDIPYYSVSYHQQYLDRVFSRFLSEYRKGRTPNPDVLCNREIKFAPLLELAESLDAQKLATGHFAGVEKRDDGLYHLLTAADGNKDQTYFLCMLTQAQLSKAMFPLKDITKSRVREIARAAGLPVAEKKDSTGVCFIGERNFRQFLSNYLPAQPGEIVSPEGEVLGRHDGLMYYTLGQRKGLGIGGRGTGEAWFVVGKDLPGNRLIVSQGQDSPLLYTRQGTAEEVSWISGLSPVPCGQEFACKARFRHRQPLQDVLIMPRDDRVDMEYLVPQRAVTPGQTVAFYKNDECLGGGVIS